MNHKEAMRIVSECLERPFVSPVENEDLAFKHLFFCMEVECGEFWQRMRAMYPDPVSRGKLLKHDPYLFWAQRN